MTTSGDTAQATMDASCIGPLFQHMELLGCWLTDDGESVWLWRDDLALVLTLDLESRCPDMRTTPVWQRSLVPCAWGCACETVLPPELCLMFRTPPIPVFVEYVTERLRHGYRNVREPEGQLSERQIENLHPQGNVTRRASAASTAPPTTQGD